MSVVGRLLPKTSATCTRAFHFSPFAPKKHSTAKHECDSNELPVFEYGSKHAQRRVYGWGLAASGALGVPEFVFPERHDVPLREVHTPCSIPIDSRFVKDVACGFGFTVFAMKKLGKRHSRVLGCGLNTNSQLGFSPLKSDSLKSAQWFVTPTAINLPLVYPDKTEVNSVACGRAHTLLASDEGVFTLGNNAHGQCGRLVIDGEDYENCSVVHKLREVEGSVKQVVCGLDHSLVLMESGAVYAFGAGYDGQLGNETFEAKWTPTIVKGDIASERIVELSSAADTVLALSEKGDVFGWGNSEYRQLASVSDAVQLNVPRRLRFPSVRGRVVGVAAGGSSCSLVTDKGEVYVWGFGLLGQGPDVTLRTEPSPIPQAIFGISELRPDVKVVRVVAGLHYMAALTDSGELYTWGKNRDGVLGLGHGNDQFFPFKVPISADVLKVACGPTHSLAICRSWI